MFHNPSISFIIANKTILTEQSFSAFFARDMRKVELWTWSCGSFIGAGSVRTGGSPTVIAKLLSTFAHHGTAAKVPLDPEVALGTLLVLGSTHKLYKLLVILVETTVDLVLSTGHIRVVQAFTLEAVVLLAGRAAVVGELLLELEDSSAAGSRTPPRTIVLLYELVE